MATRRSFITCCCLGLVALAATAAAAPALGAGQGKVRLAIVVAKDSPLADISFYDLKRLYQGETINVAGRRLAALNLPPHSEERVRFDHAVLGMAPDEVARYWIDRKIRGQSGAPKSLETPDLVQRVVARLAGGVGYARVSDVSSGVKVLRVSGKTPSDSGYPIEY